MHLSFALFLPHPGEKNPHSIEIRLKKSEKLRVFGPLSAAQKFFSRHRNLAAAAPFPPFIPCSR
jgi:hypothetical protein